MLQGFILLYKDLNMVDFVDHHRWCNSAGRCMIISTLQLAQVRNLRLKFSQRFCRVMKKQILFRAVQLLYGEKALIRHKGCIISVCGIRITNRKPSTLPTWPIGLCGFPMMSKIHLIINIYSPPDRCFVLFLVRALSYA